MAMKRYGAKLASILLASCLLSGITAGCGKTDTTTGTVEPTPTSTTSPTTLATTAGTTGGTTPFGGDADGLNPPGQLPIVNESMTLRVLLFDNDFVLTFAYGGNAFTTWLQDRTGVELELILYPEIESKNSASVALASDFVLDNVDLCLVPLDLAIQADFAAQSVIAPLEDLFGAHGTFIKDLLTTHPYAAQAVTAPDGHIYTFPKGGSDTIVPDAYGMRMWIHSGFLTRYGKGMPGTTDEMYDFLKWAVANDPNGNGQTDEIGWTGAENRSVGLARPTDFLMNAFTLQNDNGYYQENDVIHAAFVEDDYREGLRYLARLMEEGLMDPLYATYDTAGLADTVAKSSGSKAAVVSASDLDFLPEEIRAGYEIVPPLEGPRGFVNAYYDYYAKEASSGVCIPTISIKKELAVRWMDALYDQEVALRALYGEKETDWTVPPQGTTAVDGGPALFREINNLWAVPQQSQWQTSFPVMWDRYGTVVAEAETGSLEAELYDAARLYEGDVIPCSVPDFFFDAETDARADALEAAIDDLYRTGVTEFLFDTRDLDDDTVWGEFVAQLENAGLREYLAVMQEEYDAKWVESMPQDYAAFPQR